MKIARQPEEGKDFETAKKKAALSSQPFIYLISINYILIARILFSIKRRVDIAF
jgi:hypothetical protein